MKLNLLLLTFLVANQSMPSVEEVPTLPTIHVLQDLKEANATDLIQENEETPEDIKGWIYFLLGSMTLLIIISCCHLLCFISTKTERERRRDHSRKIHEYHYQYDRTARWAKNHANVTFDHRPAISYPFFDFPASGQIFPLSPNVNSSITEETENNTETAV